MRSGNVSATTIEPGASAPSSPPNGCVIGCSAVRSRSDPGSNARGTVRSEARGDSDEPDRGRHSEPRDERGARPLSVLDPVGNEDPDADVRGEQDERQDPPEVRVVDDRAVQRR